MRVLLVLLALVLGGCEAPDAHERLAGLQSHESLGMRLRELPRDTLAALGLGYGLAVVRLGAAAERAGLRLGDVVYGVNQREIGSLREFSQAVGEPADGRVSLLVRRGRTDLYVPFSVDARGAPALQRQPTDTLLRI